MPLQIAQDQVDIPHVINEDTIGHMMKLNKGVDRQTIVGAMKISGWKDEIGATAPPAPAPGTTSKSSSTPLVQVPKWKDVALHLDPMMSASDYEGVRKKYFQDMIVPHIPRGQDLDAVYREFQKRTERTPMTSFVDRQILKAKVATTAAQRELLSTAPSLLSDKGKQKLEKLNQQEEGYTKLAARDDINLLVPKIAGNLVGGIIPLVAASALVGPLAEGVAGTMFEGATAAKRAKMILEGGLSFAAVDTARATAGRRLQAGVKGFGEGVLFSLPLIPFVKASGLASTTEEAEKLVQKAIDTPQEVPPAVHEVIAKKIETDAKIIKSQELLPNSIVRNPKIRGVQIALLPKEGQGILTVEVKPGRESEAINQIRRAQEAGAEFNAVHFNPTEEARAYKFLREARDSDLWKYEDPMLVEVQKGFATKVAKDLREQGIAADALTDKHVELNVKRAEVNDPLHEAFGPLNARRAADGTPLEESRTLTQDIDKSVEVAKSDAPKMPVERAELLARQAGYDPKNVDIDAIRNMGEAELNRLLEVRDRVRQSGGEFDPLGVLKKGEKSSMAELPPKTPSKLYRVVPVGKEAPKAGEEVLTFGDLEHKRVYAGGGWYGEDVNLYEIEGESKFFQTESVQTHYESGPPEREIVHEVPVWKTKVKSAKLLEKLGIEEEPEPKPEDFTPVPEEGKSQMLELGAARSFKDVKTGDRLVDQLRASGQKTVVSKNFQISFHPFRAQITVPESLFQRLNPGAKAVLYHNWADAMEKLGVKIPDLKSGYPAMMITAKTLPEEKFHEFLHAIVTRSGLLGKVNEMIPAASRLHAFAIASTLEKSPVYAGKLFDELLNEVWAYAGSAVRYGETKFGQDWMEQLVKWDGSVEHIEELVKGTAENIAKYSEQQLDSVSNRIVQRKMQDLMRRADKNVAYNIETTGLSARWNPESLGWQVREGNRLVNLKTTQDVWDFVLARDVSDAAPSYSYPLEVLGMRGPMAVVAPKGRPPMPTAGINAEDRWVGWSAVSGWFRPFLPWVSSLDTKINKSLAKRGEQFGVFDAVKRVDSQVRDGDKWLADNAKGLADILKGTPSQKQNDYFAALTYKPADFGTAAAKYKLTPKDIEKVKALETWLTDFRNDTGIQTFQWLRELYPRLNSYNFAPEAVWSARYDPKSAGFWEKAVREGDFKAEDNHMGRFGHFLLKEGFEKKFTGEPLRMLQRMIDLKVGPKGQEKEFLGKALKWPLQNYVNYVKGIPDQTQVAINRGMKDFLGNVQNKLKDINKFLPGGMKIPGSELNISPKLMQRFMVLTYASGLGLRPAIALRDGLQVLSTTLPVLGARKFSRGMELMFSEKGRGIADAAGAFLNKTNIGELYGDIFGEIPTEGRLAEGLNKFANLMMSPSRWGHNFSRGVTFLGEYDSATRAIKDLRAGTLDQASFMKKTSLWFMDEQVSSKLLVRAQGKEAIADVAKSVALETVDLTQWPFRRGTQPAVLRTGLGRIFGQFGMWPANYADFLTRMYQKSQGGEFRKQALGSVGVWLASNYAATQGMEALGADVSKWYFMSPAGYTPSMHFELVKDLAAAPEQTDEGRAARKRILEYPLNFIPARVELENILKVMENKPEIGLKQGALDPQLLEVLGFKPLHQMPELSPEDEMKYQLGFKGVRAPTR